MERRNKIRQREKETEELIKSDRPRMSLRKKTEKGMEREKGKNLKNDLLDKSGEKKVKARIVSTDGQTDFGSQR